MRVGVERTSRARSHGAVLENVSVRPSDRHVLGALPGLEASRQHLDVRESLLFVLVCPPGRSRLLRSSTVEYDLPIARQLRFLRLELDEIDRAFDVE